MTKQYPHTDHIEDYSPGCHHSKEAPLPNWNDDALIFDLLAGLQGVHFDDDHHAYFNGEDEQHALGSWECIVDFLLFVFRFVFEGPMPIDDHPADENCQSEV